MNADDPLLPPPETWFTGPSEAPDGSDPLQGAFNAVALPARDNRGRPVVPPDEHVLDHLARVWDLVDPDEAPLRPGADTAFGTEDIYLIAGMALVPAAASAALY